MYSLAVLPANKQMPGDMFPRRSCFILVALLDEKKKGITVSCVRNQLSWPLESYFSSWYYILSSIWRESSYNYDIWRRHKVARTYPCFLSKSVVSLVWCSLLNPPLPFHFSVPFQNILFVLLLQVLQKFPDGLQYEIHLHMHLTVLSDSFLFHNFPESCLRALAKKMHRHHHLPGHQILHDGDDIDSVHLVRRGKIEILSNSAEQLGRISTPNYASVYDKKKCLCICYKTKAKTTGRGKKLILRFWPL